MSDLIAETLANPVVSAIGTSIVIAVVALWIAAAWWASRDAARRTESTTAAFLAAVWIILSTPLLLPLALAVYAVARPATTAAEHRAQSLVAALQATAAGGSACSGCGSPTEPAWLRCPRCATWLSAPCASCGEWSPAALEICPYCGREGHAVPAVVGLAPVPVSLGRARRAERFARRQASAVDLRHASGA